MQNLKQKAAQEALKYVKPNMKLGIGSGSTIEEFIPLLAKAVGQGLDIVGVATSKRTGELCQKLSIPLSTLNETPELDLTIDGTDEVDSELNLIKGGGGALLREKIVACASRQLIVIADSSKQVERLGKFPLPVEIDQFAHKATIGKIAKLAPSAESLVLRQQGQGAFITDGRSPFITDGGNYIVDVNFEKIANPQMLEQNLNAIAGVVENGLFTKLANRAILAFENEIKIVERQ